MKDNLENREESTYTGYSAPNSGMLSEADIRSFLESDLRKNASIFVHDTLDSTSSEARRLVENGFSGVAVVLAEQQTGGRGRRGKSFYSPRGTGLYMTLVIPGSSSFFCFTRVTTTAAVAAARAIEKVTGAKTAIKWVNDIYTYGKKVCGILAEAVNDIRTGAVKGVLIGVGVNISTKDFPKEIADVAGSLSAAETDRCRLAAEFVNEYVRCAGEGAECMAEYRRRSMVIGKRINCFVNNECYEATASDIDDDGALIILTDSGERRVLNSGEITVRLGSMPK